MNAPRASRYQLDRVALGLAADDSLAPEDQARLEAVRAADGERRQMVPPSWLGGLATPPPKPARAWRRQVGGLSWMLAPTMVMLAFALIPGVGAPPASEGPTRAKGGSQVELLVRRGDLSFVFDGRPLKEHDTLVFRYTSLKRYLVLAGREDGGALSTYAALPIEPGQGLVAETGVRLDDYEGGEWFYAVLTDEPIETADALELISSGRTMPSAHAELFRFRVEREAR